jgi:hypothetical protein
MEILPIILSACITIFSIGLLLVSLASFKRYRNQKLLFISIVFLFFLIKGILLSLSLFIDDIARLLSLSLFSFFDFLILIFLFIATLKR